VVRRRDHLRSVSAFAYQNYSLTYYFGQYPNIGPMNYLLGRLACFKKID
jgi:hypothetical protein